MFEDELSGALVEYLGYGDDSYPHNHSEKIHNKYGLDHGGELLDRIQLIFDELEHLSPDWSSMSIKEIWEFVEKEMHARHPKLTSEALKALGFAYTYWNK